jgi:hypothetical protein
MGKIYVEKSLSQTDSHRTKEAAEEYLGEPEQEGMVLASDPNGRRYWVNGGTPTVVDGGDVGA